MALPNLVPIRIRVRATPHTAQLHGTRCSSKVLFLHLQQPLSSHACVTRCPNGEANKGANHTARTKIVMALALMCALPTPLHTWR